MTTTIRDALTQRASHVDPAATIAAGVELASLGFHILPILAGQKRPPFPTGQGHAERASRDPEEIAAWFESRPDWELAVVLHLSGHIAVDVDIRRKDPRVVDRFVAIEQRSGYSFSRRWSDATMCQVTPKRGWHYIWKAPENVDWKSQLGKNIELQRHILVVAPSRGRRWIRPPHEGIADFPEPLHTMARRPPPKTLNLGNTLYPATRGNIRGLIRTVEKATSGNRNRTLYWASCKVREMIEQGIQPPENANDELILAAMNTGMPIEEAVRTVNSGNPQPSSRG